MPAKRGPDIIHRWEGNPVITIESLPFRCADITNAGAVKLGDEYVLLVTIESLEGTFSIYPARSKDGYRRFEVAAEPLLAPSENGEFAVYEERGVLDARIVSLEGSYYICYNALSHHGYRLALARTDDFRSVERVGLTSLPDTKTGTLFSRKINGQYARLERPAERGSIWLSYSDDLQYWGGSEVVMTPRGGFWDCDRIGVAAPPMETDDGWVVIYYGVKGTSAGPLFRLGAAMLDPDNPARVLHRTNVPILAPREDYERIGDLPNLVFSCGALLEDGGKVRLYYGASNSCICIGTLTLSELMKDCLASEKEF